MPALPPLKPLVGRQVRRLQHEFERRVYERGAFDDSYRTIPLANLGLDHPDRMHYQPAQWSYLRRALRGQRIGPADVLVDIGSGKGRVVFQAAQRPFGRVVGVEISEALNAEARRAVERDRSRRRAGAVELLTADAGVWSLPDDATYVFLNNPFSGELFAAVVANVIASVDRRPRPLTLIYANPRCEDLVLATGRFVRVRTSHGWRRDRGDEHRISLYAATPAPV